MTTYVVSDTGGWVPLGSSGLPSSGVTAGTYGDSTHVARVTVNAQGQVTAASAVAISGATLAVTDGTTTVSNVTSVAFSGATVSSGGAGVANVAVSGGGGGGMALLFDSLLGADAASIDTGAGGIAGGYKALVIWITAQSALASFGDSLHITVNNDTGANYDWAYIEGQTTAAAGTNLGVTSWGASAHGTGATSGYPGITRMTIPNYAGTTFYKVGDMSTIILDASAGNCFTDLRSIGWRNTAAISRMAVVTGSGSNLKAGSRLTIYGTP